MRAVHFLDILLKQVHLGLLRVQWKVLSAVRLAGLNCVYGSGLIFG